MYGVYDKAREKAQSVITFFFVCCLWWWWRKNSFCYNPAFCILSMMNQEKKLILLSHCFLNVVNEGAREKTDFVLTLFFLCCLWWNKRKNSICGNIIFCILSMMEQEKKLFLLYLYFLYVVYDGAREKTHSVTTLFFLWFLWLGKRRISFCYSIIFCMLSMMEQEKKLILFKRYVFYFVYDGAREKSHSFITLFFLCCVW